MITIAGQLENLTSRADKTWKVTIGTQELTPENVATLSQGLHQFGYFAWKGETFSNEETKALDALKAETGGKTQSQRLRNVLYVLYEQDQEGFTTFDHYYLAKTEKIIDYLKRKIDDR